MIKTTKIILVFLFVGCFFQMPYSYYEIVRVLGMIGFAYLGYNSYKSESNWMWFYGVSGLLINPFYKFYITREVWLVIDAFWILLLLLSFKISNNIKL